MTREKFDALIQQIESYKTKTEPLTAAEVQFVDHYSKLYNTYVIANSSHSGISSNSYITLIDQADKLKELYALQLGNAPLFTYEPPVEKSEPTVGTVIDVKLDPTNPTKYINELVAAGSDVDQGTKVEDVSRLQGTVNEYSSPVTLIEAVKQQVAQQAGTPIVLTTETATVPEGVSTDTVELLKAQVSQLLQEGEIAIVPEVVFNKNELPLYSGKGNLEGQLEIFNMKLDSFDPNTKFVHDSPDPYDKDTLDMYTAKAGIELLTAQELAAELEKIQQQQLVEEQAAAVESFTGGG